MAVPGLDRDGRDGEGTIASRQPAERLGGPRSDQLDPGADAGGGGSPVARQQRRMERLGERDIGGVVGGEVMAQRPDLRRRQIVGIASQAQVGEIVEGLAAYNEG